MPGTTWGLDQVTNSCMPSWKGDEGAWQATAGVGDTLDALGNVIIFMPPRTWSYKTCSGRVRGNLTRAPK